MSLIGEGQACPERSRRGGGMGFPNSMIKQIVPPEWCFKCDICCRFPESTSFLAPYFTGEEITSAVQTGACETAFLNKTGCKITLMPYEEAYICPAFDPMTAHCRIYKARPFDCVLYPFAIMLDETGKRLYLDSIQSVLM